MSNPDFQIEQLAIVGVGLIGGSIAAAAKQQRIARTVLGYGRNPVRLEAARARGIIDHVATDVTDLVNAEIVVICTPVDQIAVDVCAVLAATSAGTLVTDAGSTKGTIQQQVAELSSESARYVGAHPLAGSHLTGFEHADPLLYRDRTCILTPSSQNPIQAIERVRAFWQSLGMYVTQLPPEKHDQVLALTSHLPHLAAAAVANMVDETMLEYAATGYRDTTRVAAGDPELWTAIFSQNAVPLAAATTQLIESLQWFRNALELGRETDLREFLKRAQERRQRFRERDLQNGQPFDQ